MGVVVVMMMVSGRESGSGAEHQDGENQSLFHDTIVARVSSDSCENPLRHVRKAAEGPIDRGSVGNLGWRVIGVPVFT
jgi:hypothetical protein